MAIARFMPSSPCGRHAFAGLVADHMAVAAGIDLLMEGGRPRGPYPPGQGMAMRYRATAAGRSSRS